VIGLQKLTLKKLVVTFQIRQFNPITSRNVMYENKGQTDFYLSLKLNMFLHGSFMKTTLIRKYIDHSCILHFKNYIKYLILQMALSL